MMTEDTRKILMMACLSENNRAKDLFKEDKLSLEALQAVHRALEGLQVQINIEAKK